MAPPARSSSPPRSSSPTSDPSPYQEKEARLKRRIAKLEAQVASQNATPTANTSAKKSYVTMGRSIRKVVSLYEPIEALVNEHDRRQELAEKREEEGDDTPIIHTLEQDRLFRGFQELQQFVPAIKSALVNLSPGELDAMFSEMQRGATGAVGDDVGTVRAAMVGFLPKGVNESLVASSRSNRGPEGEVTGPFIFPVDYDYKNPDIRAKVINGDEDYRITADQWPMGVYQNSVYDPNKPEKGLFKAKSLLQTYLHIFTAPKSAVKLQTEDASDAENVQPSSASTEPPRKKRKVAARTTSKKSVANKIHLRRVTPRSIAYAAVQHRFALSDAPAWNETDGDFDYILYYNNIVDWFEAAPGPVAQKEVDELLVWWNQRVFKNAGRSVAEPSRASSSSVLTMREKRAARELNA
ncbi:hypothetical protein B0H19DRAFT_1249085 [Mycena capillaripes]|nr:hypothetical protein B0H19DRAFT_1249085 [Mycena capillaripes]